MIHILLDKPWHFSEESWETKVQNHVTIYDYDQGFETVQTQYLNTSRCQYFDGCLGSIRACYQMLHDRSVVIIEKSETITRKVMFSDFGIYSTFSGTFLRNYNFYRSHPEDSNSEDYDQVIGIYLHEKLRFILHPSVINSPRMMQLQLGNAYTVGLVHKDYQAVSRSLIDQ